MVQPLPARRRPRAARRRVGAVLATAVAVVGASLVAVTPAAAATASSLAPGDVLASGAQLVAPGGAYKLVMQTDGNLVQYGSSGARWYTGTRGNNGATLRFQTDGNVVLYATDGRPLWYTNTRGNPGATSFVIQGDGNMVAYGPAGALWNSGTRDIPNAGPFTGGPFTAAMQSDGNFVLTYRGSASPDVLWASNTYGHPNARLVLQGDGNLVVYDAGVPLWNSGTYGNPGAFVLMQTDGNLVVYSRSGRALWNSGTAGATSSVGPSGDSRFTLAWSHAYGDVGAGVVFSSPALATLDGGGPAVIQGDRAGTLYAARLADGAFVPGWPVSTGIAVDSTPSVAGSGSGAKLFVGLGTASASTRGGILSLAANGAQRFYRPFAAFPDGSGTTGVQGSVALGSLQTPLDAVSGTMNQMQYALNAETGQVLSGFPWFGADSNFSTPSIVSINGANYVVQGGDSTAGIAFDTRYTNGGHIRVLQAGGNGGNQANPGAGLACVYDTDQNVESSPAIGNFLSGGRTGIAIGTGTFYQGARDSNALIAVDTSCVRQWQITLDGTTASSPALVDVTGSGRNALVEGTFVNSNSGSVYAVDPTNGAVIWRASVPGGVHGSITSIDLGGGYESLLVPTFTGVWIVDGKTGRVQSNLTPGIGVQNSATVTVDPGGAIGVTVGGYNGYSRGVMLHFRLNGSSGVTSVGGPGQWPSFKRDAALSGVSNS